MTDLAAADFFIIALAVALIIAAVITWGMVIWKMIERRRR